MKAAEERLITSLTMVTLTDLPGQGIFLDAPEAVETMLVRVIQGIAPVSGVSLSGRTARHTLQALQDKENANTWIFILRDNMNEKSIWQDRFQIIK